MYISTEQLRISMDRLAEVHPFFGTAFLAFKRDRLPVGKATSINFTAVMSRYLDEYFRPLKGSTRYFLPFIRKATDDGWKAERYASTTLQRIVADSFGDCFLHEKGTSLWGWRPDYLQQLQKLLARPLPPFDLAVWLYRDKDWPEPFSPESIVTQFYSEHNITPEEIDGLFSGSAVLTARTWVTPNQRDELDYGRLLATPPDAASEPNAEGALVRLIHLKNVAPCQDIVYEPDPRINLIAGDNSLGKTFLLDSVWWSISGHWPERPPTPSSASRSTIEYALGSVAGEVQIDESSYDSVSRSWLIPSRKNVRAGLSLYCRYDGSYCVYDPADAALSGDNPEPITLRPDELWNGQERSVNGRSELVSLGIVADWARWQLSEARFGRRYAALEVALRTLSPGEGETLRPGNLVSLPYDQRDFPTVEMPYGEVPITLASAGVKRILGLAYMLVWAWYRHTENSEVRQVAPQKQIVFLMDEVESHLHPKWQRRILPSLVRVIQELAPEVDVQLHIATHSPIVLASSEATFLESVDQLHHLRLENKQVVLERLDFIKRGSIDAWLTWEMFGVSSWRPVEAEKAVNRALEIQRSDHPDSIQVREVDQQLRKLLADEDPVWNRWIYFARQHGVDR